MTEEEQQPKRRWRKYRTEQGRSPVDDYLDKDIKYTADRAEIVAAMKIIQDKGLTAARHLRDDLYEVRVDGKDNIFRIIFAVDGEKSQILLALEGFTKKSQRTPLRFIRTAEDRWRDWQRRGSEMRKEQGR